MRKPKIRVLRWMSANMRRYRLRNDCICKKLEMESVKQRRA